MRSYQAEIYFHDHFSECLEWLDYDWQLAEDYIECWNVLMDCTEENYQEAAIASKRPISRLDVCLI